MCHFHLRNDDEIWGADFFLVSAHFKAHGSEQHLWVCVLTRHSIFLKSLFHQDRLKWMEINTPSHSTFS